VSQCSSLDFHPQIALIMQNIFFLNAEKEEKSTLSAQSADK